MKRRRAAPKEHLFNRRTSGSLWNVPHSLTHNWVTVWTLESSRQLSSHTILQTVNRNFSLRIKRRQAAPTRHIHFTNRRMCHIRLHISESLARVQSTTVITYNIANGESLIYTYTHSSSSTSFKGLSQCRTLTLGLSWDSQVRCQPWKFITLSVKTPSVSSLRKYSNSTLTDMLK